MLVLMGALVSIAYRVHAGGRRLVMRWGARGAPALCYTPGERSRLVIVYDACPIGDASSAERREYAQTHWGLAGVGERCAGTVLRGGGAKLGAVTEITYATRKGGDGALVNYWHTFGDGAPRGTPLVLPALHDAGVGKKRYARLAGGSYTVTSHGIVG